MYAIFFNNILISGRTLFSRLIVVLGFVDSANRLDWIAYSIILESKHRAAAQRGRQVIVLVFGQILFVCLDKYCSCVWANIVLVFRQISFLCLDKYCSCVWTNTRLRISARFWLTWFLSVWIHSSESQDMFWRLSLYSEPWFAHLFRQYWIELGLLGGKASLYPINYEGNRVTQNNTSHYEIERGKKGTKSLDGFQRISKRCQSLPPDGVPLIITGNLGNYLSR